MNNKIFNFAAGLLLALATWQPLAAQEASASADTSEKSLQITSIGRNTRWRYSYGFNDFKIEMRGKLEVTDDDRDIKSLSDDGYLEITKTVFGSRRTVVIESEGGGRIKRTYYEGRNKMDWEQGRQWLGEILPEIVRSTTLGAEGRVNRYYAKGGTTAVLQEIAVITSDYVQAHYAKLLLAKDIPAADVPVAIQKISSSISSDYYLTSVLQKNVGKLLDTPAAADAFFKGAQQISSDYYKTSLLKDALKSYAGSPAQIKTILQAASSVHSDYYLSALLIALLDQEELKDESLTDLMNVALHIHSDYYRTEVMSRALGKKNLSKAALKNLLEGLTDVNSDYYKTNVLNRLAEHTKLDAALQLQVIQLLKAVTSDYYASVTMTQLIKHQQLTDEAFDQLTSAAGALGSDYYAAEVLKKASRNTLSKPQLLALLRAAALVKSDTYLSDLLVQLAPQVRTGDAALKDQYRQTAKQIDSDTYYGRAIKAID